jgi:hypothetical protein
MHKQAHDLIFEASIQVDALCNLLSELPDGPLESMEPFHFIMLLRPASDRLKLALTAMSSMSKSSVIS